MYGIKVLNLAHRMSGMTFGNGPGNHPSTWLEHNPQPFTTAILSKRNSSSPHMFMVIWIHVWGWVKTYHILHILIYILGINMC